MKENILFTPIINSHQRRWQIHRLLEYADMVWDNCTKNEINALGKKQIEAARIATGVTKLVSLDMLYRETD